MRELRTLNLTLISLIKFGRDTVLAQPKRGIIISHEKGGDRQAQLLMCLSRKFLFKKEMKTSHAKNSTGSQTVNLLIRAADWVRAKGQIRPISDVPALEEQIGILFNMIRRREKFTLEKLANESGFAIEELIAFEAGLLPRLRMCEMFPELAKSVGIDHEELLQQNINKLFKN